MHVTLNTIKGVVVCALSSIDQVYLSPKNCVVYSTLNMPINVLLFRGTQCYNVLLTSSISIDKSSIRCSDILKHK